MGSNPIEADWRADPARWHGEWAHPETGSGVSIIFNETDKLGFGPALHSHPYAETFIVRSGCVRFEVDGLEIIATAGDILVAPPNAPHRFENLGPDRLEMIDIHANPDFVTTWL
ncbi:cupin domain-containing protein [uncultured Nitratireductor sp.]|uniref:cupin domain-containing protein n=1 Tax=uncultured Nitratireductor sp. TaxID=520953 RepID=UPI0025CC5454|nr:cupin domain-containing protein [uncultured Nitratireductor sp.]